MTAALVGFLGVVAGLAVGFGYRFWAGRRSELAEAVVATAVLGEELRSLKATRGSEGGADQPRVPVAGRTTKAPSPELPPLYARLQETWREQRRWLITLMRPEDFKRLAASMPGSTGDSATQFNLDELIARVESLNELLWAEHEAFILVPYINYFIGNTLSRRVRDVLDGSIDADRLAGGTGSSAPW